MQLPTSIPIARCEANMRKIWLILGVGAITLVALGVVVAVAPTRGKMSKEPSARGVPTESAHLAAAFKEIDRLQLRLAALEADRRGATEREPSGSVENIDDAAEPMPELTPEENRRQAIEVKQTMLTHHAAEARDNVWANRMETDAGTKLQKALASSGVEMSGVDCRTTLCLVQVKGTYDKVQDSLPKALMQTTPADCAFSFSLPEPEDGTEGEAYEGVASLDCGQMRENGT